MIRTVVIILFVALVSLTGYSIALAAGDEGRGKVLFNDPKLGGGTSGLSCNSCHSGGKGLEGVSLKKEWLTPAGAGRTLEDTVNICISAALKGKPLDVKSQQMQDVVAYLKSLKPHGKPKKKGVEGC